jgi:hypothetical protein
MKKIALFFGIIAVGTLMMLSSCNSSRTTVCPAYPPSTYQGNIQQDNGVSLETGNTVEYTEVKLY